MTIHLMPQIEQELRRLAGQQGRELQDVVEAACRSYLDAEAITDLSPAEVAQTQMALMPELIDVAPWPAEQEPDTDAAR
jgi:hypothetical protein